MQRNEVALQELIILYGNKVVNTALNILHHHEEAEEITQDVFIEVFQSIHQFDQRSQLSTWIYRITINKSLDQLRKRKRKKRFGQIMRLQFSTDHELELPHFHHPGIELEQKESMQLIFGVLDQLPENQKTAFVLKTMEDLSQKEIAEIMKISESAVESLLTRARDRLRKRLGEYFEKNENSTEGKIK